MFGEIYLCRFPFTDGVGAKIRPALVLFDLGRDAAICRVTGLFAKSPMVVASDINLPCLLEPQLS
jgi:hypothetical protein